jgi:hypothetical protein
MQLLAKAAMLLCVSSRGKSYPRMVKRRNSPFASHDRTLEINRQQVFVPVLLSPLLCQKVVGLNSQNVVKLTVLGPDPNVHASFSLFA